MAEGAWTTRPTTTRTPATAAELRTEVLIIGGGVGAAWERRLSTVSLDYDADKAGSYLGHSLSLTYRQRF